MDNAHPHKNIIGTSKHSEFGIASFAVALFVILLFLAIFSATIILQYQSDTGNIDHREQMAIGLLGIFWFILLFIGIVLGTVGVLQRNRKKMFALFGLAINAGIFLAVVCLFLLL